MANAVRGPRGGGEDPILDFTRRMPSPLLSWDWARRLGREGDAGVLGAVKSVSLSSPDESVRELALEALAAAADGEVVAELRGVFQKPPVLISKVGSVRRLSARSALPESFYLGVDGALKAHGVSASVPEPLDLVYAIPNIIFPRESEARAGEVISGITRDPSFFRGLSSADLGRIHALFYADPDSPRHFDYRSVKMWDFGAEGTPVEPYDQVFTPPLAVPYVMESFARKVREEGPSSGNPVRFIGESFYAHNIIHPWFDCNGRSNFLLMNLYLLSRGYPYVKMEDDDLPRYYSALNRDEPTEFTRFLGDLLVRRAGRARE